MWLFERLFNLESEPPWPLNVCCSSAPGLVTRSLLRHSPSFDHTPVIAVAVLALKADVADLFWVRGVQNQGDGTKWNPRHPFIPESRPCIPYLLQPSDCDGKV